MRCLGVFDRLPFAFSAPGEAWNSLLLSHGNAQLGFPRFAGPMQAILIERTAGHGT
jgi:hypothetical protein